MRSFILMLFLLLSVGLFSQENTTTSEKEMTPKDVRKARKKAKHCHCPYQRSSTVWSDIWNDGIVGTSRSIYQSTIKPQVIGNIMTVVQGSANAAPVPTIISQTAVALTISEVQKSRRNHKHRHIPEVGKRCNCPDCPYHPKL